MMSETEQEAESASRGKGLPSLRGSQGAAGGMEQISLEVHTSSLFVVFFFFLIFKEKGYLFKN